MASEYAAIIERIEGRRDKPAKATSFANFSSAFSRLSREGWPESGRGVVLVAGTNGKGSVSKTLETLLIAGGAKVGLFTSPHLMKTTERIRSLGSDLSEEEFVAAYRAVEPLVNEFNLSHFEVLTMMMCEVFFGGRIRERVDRAVIEVGLGGRLDPTRVIPHEATIITRLGLDHQALLGNTIEEIAREKFGAVDPGNLVVHFPFPPRVRGEASWVCAEPYPFRVDNGRWIIETPWGESPLALLGERAVENSSVALKFLSEWGVDVAQVLPALAQVAWPGRMEKFLISDRRVYLSGDHNLQGVESLREILAHLAFRKLFLVAGIGANKDAGEILEALTALTFPTSLFLAPSPSLSLSPKLILTQTSYRASGFDAYGIWRKRALAEFADPQEALRFVLTQASAEDLILVTGSLYLVGDLRKSILQNRSSL